MTGFIYALFVVLLIILGLLAVILYKIYKKISIILHNKEEQDKHHIRQLKMLESVISMLNNEKYLIYKGGIDTYRQIVAAQEIDRMIGLGHTTNLRGWPISPDALLEILKYIKEYKPKLIIELGSGSTTAAISSLIKKYNLNTKLISVDHEKLYLEKTKLKVKYTNNVEFVHAPLKKQKITGLKSPFNWYDINLINKVVKNRKADLLIVDGPPESTNNNARLPALRALASHLTVRAAIFLDDYNRTGERAAAEDWVVFDKDNNLTVESIETEKGLAFFKRG